MNTSGQYRIGNNDSSSETGIRHANSRPFITVNPTRNNNVICRYFLRGTCRFDELCSFAHILPNDDSSRRQQDNNIDNSSSSTVTLTTNNKTNDPSSWVMAPIFVPKYQEINNASGSQTDSILNGGENNSNHDSSSTSGSVITNSVEEPKSYAEVVSGDIYDNNSGACGGSVNILCPYEVDCPYGDTCPFEHGEMCELCARFCLHPKDKEQRKKHIAECIQQHERNMELSFAIARSKDKTCGICFDIIVEKAGHEQRFGILPNCNHVFCLQCIRKWRLAKHFDNKIIRACPECRTPSDFVCPSAFWVETKEEKDKLIGDYKSALGEKDCKYFKMGKGKCPFGNRCFYKHALPNGVRVDVGVPQRQVRKIHRGESEILDLFDIYLFDFVDQRDYSSWFDGLSNMSDSDESDWSDELF